MREVPNFEELASLLGCKVGKLQTIYLGLLLGAPFKSPSMSDVVEKKLHKKLAAQKRQSLKGW